MPRSLFSLFIIIFIFLSSIVRAQSDTEQWLIEECRITTTTDGTFMLCQEKGECAEKVTGSSVNCTTYTYKVIANISVCISKCCWGLDPVPANLTGPLIQQCYDQAKHRFTVYVLKIVFITLGAVVVLVIVGAFFVFGFTKNPYTGKRVWKGWWCCRRPLDFEVDRNWVKSQSKGVEQLEKNKEHLQTQINIHNKLNENERKISHIIHT